MRASEFEFFELADGAKVKTENVCELRFLVYNYVVYLFIYCAKMLVLLSLIN